MATLRQAIEARIADLTDQIRGIQSGALDQVHALQAEIDGEQKKHDSLGPWLEQELDAVKVSFDSLLTSYGDRVKAASNKEGVK